MATNYYSSLGSPRKYKFSLDTNDPSALIASNRYIRIYNPYGTLVKESEEGAGGYGGDYFVYENTLSTEGTWTVDYQYGNWVGGNLKHKYSTISVGYRTDILNSLDNGSDWKVSLNDGIYYIQATAEANTKMYGFFSDNLYTFELHNKFPVTITPGNYGVNGKDIWLSLEQDFSSTKTIMSGEVYNYSGQVASITMENGRFRFNLIQIPKPTIKIDSAKHELSWTGARAGSQEKRFNVWVDSELILENVTTTTLSLTDSQFFGRHNYEVQQLFFENPVNASSTSDIDAFIQVFDIGTSSEKVILTQTNPLNEPAISIKDGSYPDQKIFSWTTPPMANRYKTRLDNGDWTEYSADVTKTISNLSLGNHTFFVQAAYYRDGDYIAYSPEVSFAFSTSKLSSPTSLGFVRSYVNSGILSWASSYNDNDRTEYEYFIGDVSKGKTNNTQVEITGIPQGEQILKVKQTYSNSSYSSDLSTININMSKLNTPIIAKSDVKGIVYLIENDNLGWHYVKKDPEGPDDTSNWIKVTDNGTIAANFRLTTPDSYSGMQFKFYDELEGGQINEDTDPQSSLHPSYLEKTVGLVNRGEQFGNVGTHKVYGQMIFPDDESYNSAISNKIDYTINILATPTANWLNDVEGDVNERLLLDTDNIEYTPKQFIQADGLINILTTIKGFNRVVYQGSWEKNGNYGFMVGSDSAAGFYSPELDKWVLKYGNSREEIPGDTIPVNDNQLFNVEFKVSPNESYLHVNNNILFSKSSGVNPTDNIRIFDRDNEPSGKLYYCALYKDDTKVAEFIPATNSYGHSGVFDVVSRQFISARKNLVNVANISLTANRMVNINIAPGKIYSASARVNSSDTTGRIRFIYNLNGNDVYSTEANWTSDGYSRESGFNIPADATNIRLLLQVTPGGTVNFSDISVIEGDYEAAEIESGAEYVLYPMNKINESKATWMPVTTTTESGEYADFYYVDVIGDNVALGAVVSVLQPDDLSQRVGTWIPDPDPINGAIRGLIKELPTTTTSYRVRIRAASFNAWYVGGSQPAILNYEIVVLGKPLQALWDPATYTLSWSEVAEATNYNIYDNGVLIRTVGDQLEYHFDNLEDGLHIFTITADKLTYGLD